MNIIVHITSDEMVDDITRSILENIKTYGYIKSMGEARYYHVVALLAQLDQEKNSLHDHVSQLIRFRVGKPPHAKA
jgi:hypothetical protein